MTTTLCPCVTLNERGNTAAGTYHETLWEGFSAWWDKLADEALEKGYGVPECAKEDASLQPMSYETTQRIIAGYVPEAGTIHLPEDRVEAHGIVRHRLVPNQSFKTGRKKAGHIMVISIYRMESGRYEFTCYNS